MTAHSHINIIKEAIYLDIYDYIQKPSDINILISTVIKAMEKKILIDEREALQNRIDVLLGRVLVDELSLENSFKDLLFNGKKSYERLSEVQVSLQKAVRNLINNNIGILNGGYKNG